MLVKNLKIDYYIIPPFNFKILLEFYEERVYVYFTPEFFTEPGTYTLYGPYTHQSNESGKIYYSSES